MARSAQPKNAAADSSSFGARLAAIRKDRGFTQAELAEKTGLIQVVISDYERDKLRPYADVVAKLARALQISTDELLGIAPLAKAGTGRNRRFLRRLDAIDRLPKRDQDALLRTIDVFLAARKAG
ncbi:MAG: helix-turn-helix domain-containing protein [Solimonas sp.]